MSVWHVGVGLIANEVFDFETGFRRGKRKRK